MPRFFNTAGPCRPAKHFMLSATARLPGVRELIEGELSFVVHAPRQTGKTTAFLELARELTASGRYAALLASCEEGQTAGDDIEAGVMAVIRAIETQAGLRLAEELRPPPFDRSIEPASRLGALLTHWVRSCPRPVVLFLDEIDALRAASLISVLRQIRAGYPSRPEGFPQALALIGLRDVRDYKVRYRPDSDSLGTASPFNIKVESLTLRSFTHQEVGALYRQHTEDTGQVFEDDAVALAFELTQGQPWLVNALAFQITWRDVRDRAAAITRAHVEAAKEALIERRDTHLDSLVDKLREPRVRRVIEPILAGDTLGVDLLEDDVRYVEDLGVVTTRGQLAIANPIYREVIPRALSWTTQIRIHQEAPWYTGADGRLQMAPLLTAFTEFWREHAEALLKQQSYAEAAPHLILLAFLQRIVNGGGTIEREYAVGTGRMDLLLRWPLRAGGVQREALELKVWRDKRSDPLEKGLKQLVGYFERLALQEGTLVIFDRRTDAAPLAERTQLSTFEQGGYHVRLLRA